MSMMKFCYWCIICPAGINIIHTPKKGRASSICLDLRFQEADDPLCLETGCENKTACA